MILSSAHPGKWVLPKGGIEMDEGEDFVISAVRETWEEAGCEVLDSRGGKAPVIQEDFDPLKVVPKSEFHFYEMVIDQLSNEWPESSKRDRRWCTYSEARHELIKLKRPELVEALNLSSIEKDNVDTY
ncbi:hypothetical protein QCA50_016457 [Cerrena zonata]|uniref:Nudix hydrolase domain-containing protein n=1 Tax=Cerrena zonata TaxID=2478898 RepID=A0AAW0FLM5_9APHY